MIVEKKGSGFDNIKVIINCSEKLIRQGYGEIEAIQLLKDAGVQVFDQPDNLVSFIIVDDKGYFLFPQSRIFLGDNHNVRNAIEMDPFSMEQLIGIFFPPDLSDKRSLEDKLANALILSSQRIRKIDDFLDEAKTLHVLPLDEKKFKQVKEAIEKNPPMHPDLKRELDYYTTYFLWIKLKFKGANISNKTITIPKNVLPIDSEDLRKKLTSHLKLFENIENTTWYYKLKRINDAVSKFRKKYLIPIREKDGMNIMQKTDLTNFISDYNSIKNNITQTTNEVKQKITEEIETTKSKFRQALKDYFRKNPTDELKQLLLASRKEAIGELVEFMVESIDFPEADDLLGGFSLNYTDFELTQKDIENEKLLNELKEKNKQKDIKIDQLGKQGKGFQSTLF